MSTPPNGQPLSYALSFDYRCPYSNVLHDHVITGLRAGAPWQVRFLAFNLDQAQSSADGGANVEDVWDEPQFQPGMLASRAALAVREIWPEHFLDVHAGFFAARHGRNGPDITTPEGVHEVLMHTGLTAEQAAHSAHVGARSGTLDTLRTEHNLVALTHHGFGTPTFLVDTAGENGPITRATFVRYLRRSGGDAQVAVRTIERLVDMIANWGELNEFKHTTATS